MADEYYPRLSLEDEAKLDQVDNAIGCLKLNEEARKKFRSLFEDEVEKGLLGEPSSLFMVNTFVSKLPDGSEKGEYLALDLGGTNFRVCLVILGPEKKQEVELEYYNVPKNLRSGSGILVFDFLAECIHDFLQKKKLLDKKLPLGFTFSFPLTQKAIDSGFLISWSNFIDCPDVEGQDAVRLLQDAIRRRGQMQVDVVAILNDTTGTLVQGAFQDKKCAMGVCFGSGYNVCYLEKVENIKKWQGDKGNIKEVIMNTECSSMGENGILEFIRSEYDKEIDRKTILPNSFVLEKMIGGAYLGEIVRLALVRLTKEGVTFTGKASEKLLTEGSFTTKYISEIEAENFENSFDHTKKILEDLDLTYTKDDMYILKHICSVLSIRTAILSSICISFLLERMNKAETTIALDGSLIKYHPRLKQYLNRFISDMSPEKKFQLMLAEEGSGKGAGLVAALFAKKLL